MSVRKSRAPDLGYNVGVVYGPPQALSRNPVLRQIAFFAEKRAIKKWLPKEILYSVAKADHIVTVSENTKRDILNFSASTRRRLPIPIKLFLFLKKI
jgi:hypothetical protein